jgi:CBS-domain-containing membrane protein
MDAVVQDCEELIDISEGDLEAILRQVELRPSRAAASQLFAATSCRVTSSRSTSA